MERSRVMSGEGSNYYNVLYIGGKIPVKTGKNIICNIYSIKFTGTRNRNLLEMCGCTLNTNSILTVRITTLISVSEFISTMIVYLFKKLTPLT